jgi:alginate O-acetyltransferase complex protein AlgI
MVFSSLTFLFAFLPLVLLAYHAAPRGARNTVLLAASLVFYAWGEGAYVLLMLASLVLNAGAGLVVDRFRGRRAAGAVLGLFVALNLGLLAVFKYANFVTGELDALLGTSIDLEPVHLPIGISFFTFQALSYLIDVHRGDAQVQRNPLNVALYIAMFPQLVAGPIVRYHDVARQIAERVRSRADFAYGVRRFVVGLGKKVLIANVLGRFADRVFELETADLSPAVAWLGATAYGFQIYFDFSGYSDMAIGLGRMFGFRFLENFRYPYAAASVREFWRRWHISLSTWFRDYLYVPLGGSRVEPRRVYLNLVIVFFLCGLWHGAAWNFVVWGLLHGAFLVLERVGFGRVLERLPAAVGHVYTLLVVLVAWVFFRAETLPDALAYLGAMIAIGGERALPVATFLDREVLLTFLVALPASLPIVPALARRLGDRLGPAPALGRLAALSAVFGATVLYLVAGTYNPFIYFRF